MMWFDVQAALAEIDHESAEPPFGVAHVARVARPQATGFDNLAGSEQQYEATILGAVRNGRRWPGAIATTTGMGATVTYQLLDRLLAKGRLVMARDGELTVAHRSDHG